MSIRVRSALPARGRLNSNRPSALPFSMRDVSAALAAMPAPTRIIGVAPPALPEAVAPPPPTSPQPEASPEELRIAADSQIHPATPSSSPVHVHVERPCTRPIDTDYAHLVNAQRFEPWTPADRDYPAFLNAVGVVERATRSPFLASFLQHSGDFAAHFMVESRLSNGAANADERTRVNGRTLRSASYGIAQLHSRGLAGLYGRRSLLGGVATRLPAPPSSAVASQEASALFNWAPLVCTPAGLNYAVLWLRLYEQTLGRHIDPSSLGDTSRAPIATTQQGRSLVSAAQALCTPVPTAVVLMRAFAGMGSLPGTLSILTGRHKRTVTVRLTRAPTAEDRAADPLLMHLRQRDGSVVRTLQHSDPWYWQSQGNLRLAWEARTT